MQEHQNRVVYEKQELDEKISKLTAFTLGGIFIKLNDAEQERLIRQLKIMKQYSDVLAERIEYF